LRYLLDSAHHFASSPALKAKSSPMFQRTAVTQPHGQEANAIAGTYRDQGRWLWMVPTAASTAIGMVACCRALNFGTFFMRLFVPDQAPCQPPARNR